MWQQTKPAKHTYSKRLNKVRSMKERKRKKNQQRHCLEWMVIAKAKNSFFKLILLFYSKKHRLLARFKLHRNIDCLFVFTFETSGRLLRPQNQLWILSILRALYSHLSSIFCRNSCIFLCFVVPGLYFDYVMELSKDSTVKVLWKICSFFIHKKNF